eukprot:CAMPEP_0114493588 /NCGR_PEP_ID=MMETSP0109-20121206/4187_1 /TAXON_ID=29199 /ORGANISM="Chlorarachnion reptans, Strain CCCM449" /LENGTH=404 /DNA_ID=CAMNT_0001670545 /DNA_START=230 /DNA_END=1441 /DNA_ORIENTATION=+
MRNCLAYGLLVPKEEDVGREGGEHCRSDEDLCVLCNLKVDKGPCSPGQASEPFPVVGDDPHLALTLRGTPPNRLGLLLEPGRDEDRQQPIPDAAMLPDELPVPFRGGDLAHDLARVDVELAVLKRSPVRLDAHVGGQVLLRPDYPADVVDRLLHPRVRDQAPEEPVEEAVVDLLAEPAREEDQAVRLVLQVFSEFVPGRNPAEPLVLVVIRAVSAEHTEPQLGEHRAELLSIKPGLGQCDQTRWAQVGCRFEPRWMVPQVREQDCPRTPAPVRPDEHVPDALDRVVEASLADGNDELRPVAAGGEPGQSFGRRPVFLLACRRRRRLGPVPAPAERLVEVAPVVQVERKALRLPCVRVRHAKAFSHVLVVVRHVEVVGRLLDVHQRASFGRKQPSEYVLVRRRKE